MENEGAYNAESHEETLQDKNITNVGMYVAKNDGTIIQKIFLKDKRENFTQNIPSAKGFVGRGEYLLQLNEWYTTGNRVFILHGLGGSGKTALAQRFAEEVGKDYKAHIYIDLQGLHSNSLSPADIMLQILREFDPNISDNIEFEKLQKQYISRLNETSTLLLLDNAKNSEQIESLNKSNKACLVITSRESIFLTGGKDQRVQQMSADDSKSLLFSIVEEKRFEGRANELADLAGHLPMALLPLASLLASNYMLNMASLIQKYQDRKQRLSLTCPAYNLSIFASFDLSYEALEDDLKKYWRRLSIFPADFHNGATAFVWEIGPPEDFLDEILNKLCRSNLLNGDNITKRYRLHDLARDFLIEKINDINKDEFTLISRRHAEFYILVIKKAYEFIERNNYRYAQYYYDLERINIDAGRKWAGDFADSNKIIANLHAEYSFYAPELVVSRLHPRKVLEWQEERLKEAVEKKDPQQELDALKNIGTTYRSLGNYNYADNYSKRALHLAKKLKNIQIECEILSNLGVVYCDRGHFNKAADFHIKALREYEKIENWALLAKILGNIGLILRRIRSSKAIQFYEYALQIATESKNLRDKGVYLGNLGKTYMEFSAFEEAIPLLKEALEIARQFNDRESEGLFLGFLGDAFRYENKEVGRNNLRDSINILDEIDSPDVQIFRKMLRDFYPPN